MNIRRKHPGFQIAAQSPQGLEFLAVLEEALGGPFLYEPGCYLARERTHLFDLEGLSRNGTLALSSRHGTLGPVHIYIASYRRGDEAWMIRLDAHRIDRRLARARGVYAPDVPTKAAEERWWKNLQREYAARNDAFRHEFVFSLGL